MKWQQAFLEYGKFLDNLKKLNSQLKELNNHYKEYSGQLSEKMNLKEKKKELVVMVHEKNIQPEEVQLQLAAIDAKIYSIKAMEQLLELKRRYITIRRQQLDQQDIPFEKLRLAQFDGEKAEKHKKKIAALEEKVGHLDSKLLAQEVNKLNSSIQRREKDNWVNVVIMFSRFIDASPQTKLTGLKQLPAELILLILNYISPSTFLEKSAPQLINCALFIINTRQSLAKALTQDQSFQIIEKSAAIATESFSWRFFNSQAHLKRGREDEPAIEHEDESQNKKKRLTL